MPPPHRIPRFKEGDYVVLSVVHCPSADFYSKLSPRLVGPLQITAVPHPFVYTVDFGFKYPHIPPRVNADYYVCLCSLLHARFALAKATTHL